METFRYRLQTLLEHKAARKQEAERALATARAELRAAETRLEDARARQRALEEELALRRNALLTVETAGEKLARRVGDLQLLGRRIDDAKDAVMSLRLEIEERRERVEQAAAALAEAARQVEVLSKHRAKGERRFRLEQERSEAAVQDELASARFARRRP